MSQASCWLLLGGALLACGSRLPPLHLEDAGPFDAGRRDAGRRDAAAGADLGSSRDGRPLADSAPLPPALPILHYRFDGDAKNSGALGGSYNAQPVEVRYVAGKLDQAVAFDTSVAWSFLVLPNTAGPLSEGSDYTLGLWVLAPEAVAGALKEPQELFSFRSDNAVGEAGGGLACFVEAGGEALRLCYDANPAASDCLDLFVPDARWHHLLFRHDGAPDGRGADVEVYVDGSRQATLLNPSRARIFSTLQQQNMTLGQKSGFAVDELKLYDRVFDEPEQCTQVIGGRWSPTERRCSLP